MTEPPEHRACRTPEPISQDAGGDVHVYLSTACLHGQHDYCNACTGVAGTKVPGTCKFCGAPCRCRHPGCHELGDDYARHAAEAAQRPVEPSEASPGPPG